MIQPEIFDVLVVEDENQLAQMHADFIDGHAQLRLVGVARTLKDAREQLRQKRPRLILLDNYLPDGEGISLIDSELMRGLECSVIFITAASDMNTCSQAIRCGAFDYILKPISWKRLSHSLERFIQFARTQRAFKVVDQQNVDILYQLQSKTFSQDTGSKGIEENTLNLIRQIFIAGQDSLHSVDDIVSQTGLSKTTARRYLEYCVEIDFLSVEMRYGKIGHPRRLYRRHIPS
ncbi:MULTISPECIES: response regulator [Sodalis]|uniref:Transcriptional regulatory protein n=1 Tax=Sodalis ligni TaxID=2697027 RepID=A0A4R1N8Z4_9GAMM|nr:response regulator [Sodalis ligni]TCL03079.1 two-component system response regulator CitB [Sodalis ligni]